MLALVFAKVNGENTVQTIKIMSFNIQTFGVTKMSRPEVVKILVDLVSQADIIAVQEVRSVRIDPVERFMALLPDKYDYIIGPREGRSNSKEQYWVIYYTEKFIYPPCAKNPKSRSSAYFASRPEGKMRFKIIPTTVASATPASWNSRPPVMAKASLPPPMPITRITEEIVRFRLSL